MACNLWGAQHIATSTSQIMRILKPRISQANTNEYHTIPYSTKEVQSLLQDDQRPQNTHALAGKE